MAGPRKESFCPSVLH